jgi:predicted exporter
MKSPYDFLSPEERAWVARCQIAAVLLFLGLLTAVALTVGDTQAQSKGEEASAPASAAQATR